MNYRAEKISHKSILRKTREVGNLTLLSRLLGTIREMLQVRFLGANEIADAFFTAYKIPNSLRKMFAEGALSAAFVPSIVQASRSDGKEGVSGLMSIGFLFFEGFVLFLCAIAMWFSEPLIALIVPGFPQQEIAVTAQFLDILMPFIFFVSTSALIAGPLQAIGHFFVPAFGPVLLNIVYISGITACLFFNWPITYLCWIILCGGCLQLAVHLITYFKLGFWFGRITWNNIVVFMKIVPKFLLCFLSMSVMEVGLFLDTSFGSYLPKGSISLIYYANRFMGIPLGVFAVALSTILLPYFSQISSYAPRRLGFYVLEATKLVWWVLFPVMIVMMLLSNKIFVTLFVSDKFSLAQANEASSVLIASLCGLFFCAINKIVSNVYYAVHNTWLPGIIAVVSILINGVLNWVLMYPLAATGLAIATTISYIVQTIGLFFFLSYYLGFPLYLKTLPQFVFYCIIQVISIGCIFGIAYQGFHYAISLFPEPMANFLINSIGFWLWVAPLCMLYMIALYATRRYFKIRLLFLEG